MSRCELCGEPMPEGEEMFKYHGYSGSCPKPPLPRPRKGSEPEPQGVADMRAICETLGFDPTNHHNAAKCPYCNDTTSIPQGVAGGMELVRGYAIACLRANRDGGYDDRDAFWKEAMSALTALEQERGALRARVAELDRMLMADDELCTRQALRITALEARVAELEQDAARWVYLRHHWTTVSFGWNSDNSFKSMLLTIKAASTSKDAVCIESAIDSTIASAKEPKP